MTVDINLIALLFFVVATLYSIAGFGGGSSYVALLIISGVSYKIAPTLALTCNLIVVTMGTINFLRHKQVQWSLALPFMITSIVFSYFGGLIDISKTMYQLVLGCSLFIAGTKMIFFRKNSCYNDFRDSPPLLLCTIIGAILGLISGIVGIGGGIFLAPLLYILKWGNPKYIASTASLFILVNSIAGLVGHYHRNDGLIDFNNYIPLFIAVIIGGQLGSFLTNHKLSPRIIELSTSVLVMIVSLRLFWNVIN